MKGKVQTKVSYGKPGQDKARVRESRYVIKVMNDKTGGGWRSLGLSEPKDVPHLLIGKLILYF